MSTDWSEESQAEGRSVKMANTLTLSGRLFLEIIKSITLVRRVIVLPGTYPSNPWRHVWELFLRILWGRYSIPEVKWGRHSEFYIICSRSPNHWIEMLNSNLSVDLHSSCFFQHNVTGLGPFSPLGGNSSPKSVFYVKGVLCEFQTHLIQCKDRRIWKGIFFLLF